MISSDMPKDPLPRLRFNYYSTTPTSAQDFDYYANLPVIDLVQYDVHWWHSDQDNSLHRLKLFPGDWNDARRPDKRGKRLALFAPLKLDRRLLFPMNRSYCSYLICEAEPLLSNLSDDSVGGPQQQGKKGFPLQALDKGYRWEAPNLPQGLTQTLTHSEAKAHPLIYLFNVVVALEWVPDEQEQKQLAWSFRRASDFLYDVSDGSLAFGQVVFITSRDQAQNADIIIAASNRFHARSWVGSIHEKRKRMPLRIGRGEWRRGRSIPWDEPEGYRVIVHEWGHYALHLNDAYLRKIFVQETTPDKLLLPNTTPSERYIVAPHPYLLHSTVMESLEGTSELSFKEDRLQSDTTTERSLLHWLYPSCLNADLRSPNGGPGQAPFPLPHIVFEQAAVLKRRGYYDSRDSSSLSFKHPDQVLPEIANQTVATQSTVVKNHAKFDYDRCWLYVLTLKQMPKDQRKLIAQGTLELRSSYDPFKMIDADTGNMLVAMVDPIDQPEGQMQVYTGNIAYKPLKNEIALVLQQIDYGKPAPRVIVRPVLNNSMYTTTTVQNPQTMYNKEPEICILVDLLNGPQNATIWVCPLMEPVQEVNPRDEVMIKGLDGHVVVWCDQKPFITCFSHGGNPPSHTIGGKSFELQRFMTRRRAETSEQNLGGTNTEQIDFESSVDLSRDQIVLTPSITAGSSDGMVRIYFNLLEQPNDSVNYDHLRFVTTVQQDANAYDPPRPGARAMSYPFSIACSQTCKDYHLRMSLEVRYGGLSLVREGGKLFICRLREGGGSPDELWDILPTFHFGPFGMPAVATFFDEKSEPPCAFFSNSSLLFEQYQLWWIPDPPSSSS